jgi:2-methylcitrate dehydratase PrpD
MRDGAQWDDGVISGAERVETALIGGGTTSPESAAFYNGALVRYLNFNDAHLAKGETFHPSDNLAARNTTPLNEVFHDSVETRIQQT